MLFFLNKKITIKKNAITTHSIPYTIYLKKQIPLYKKRARAYMRARVYSKEYFQKSANALFILIVPLFMRALYFLREFLRERGAHRPSQK